MISYLWAVKSHPSRKEVSIPSQTSSMALRVANENALSSVLSLRPTGQLSSQSSMNLICRIEYSLESMSSIKLSCRTTSHLSSMNHSVCYERIVVYKEQAEGSAQYDIIEDQPCTVLRATRFRVSFRDRISASTDLM